jgi:hypothetical protein
MSKLHWSQNEETLLNELYPIYRGDYDKVSTHLMEKLKTEGLPFYSLFSAQECKEHWELMHKAPTPSSDAKDTVLTMEDIKSNVDILAEEADFSKNPRFSSLYEQTAPSSQPIALEHPSKVDFSKNVTKSIFGYDITPSNFNVLYDDVMEGYQDSSYTDLINQIKFPNLDEIPAEVPEGKDEPAEYLLDYRYKYTDTDTFIVAKPIIYLTDEEKEQTVMTPFDDKDPYVVYILKKPSAQPSKPTLSEQLKERKSNILIRSIRH